MKLQPGVTGDALFSTEDPPVYRYSLSRTWDRDLGYALWIMLNPSTATADFDDRTIAGCQVFARNWGLGGIVVANIFALRSTDPKNLYRHRDPVGPGNDAVLELLATQAEARMVVAAWGSHGAFMDRGRQVREMLTRLAVPLHVVNLTKEGHPGHPLYVKRETVPHAWGLEVIQ